MVFPAKVRLQSDPPFKGAGLVHERDFIEIPEPQLLLQLDQGPQLVQPPFTLQASLLHILDSLLCPKQISGSLQTLVLVDNPPLHFLEQIDHEVQIVYPRSSMVECMY